MGYTEDFQRPRKSDKRLWTDYPEQTIIVESLCVCTVSGTR